MFWQRVGSIAVGLFWGAALASLLHACLGSPMWVNVCVGVVGSVLIGLEDWRRGHPALREQVDARHQHSFCLECYIALDPSREPLREEIQDRQFVACCRCGLPNFDGITASSRQRFEHCAH